MNSTEIKARLWECDNEIARINNVKGGLFNLLKEEVQKEQDIKDKVSEENKANSKPVKTK